MDSEDFPLFSRNEPLHRLLDGLSVNDEEDESLYSKLRTPGSISIQFLLSMGMILDGETAGSPLCGFAFAFDRVRDQVYNTCCCEFLVWSAFLSLVWHMHDVCLLHGHVAHSSHYGWRGGISICVWVGNRSSAFVMMSSMIVHPVSWEWFE